jgi:hypothetical protein
MLICRFISISMCFVLYLCCRVAKLLNKKRECDCDFTCDECAKILCLKQKRRA